MKSKEQGKFIVMAAAVMLAALLLAAPVFADGEAPLEEPLAQESAETTEAPSQEETPPEEELAPPEAAEELPAQEENTTPPAADEPSAEGAEAEPIPAPEEIAADETGADETAAVVEALAEADLVLAGADGETVSLASAEGQQATIAPDPYFKVGKTYYRFFEDPNVCSVLYPLETYCFDNQGTDVIQDAVNYIRDNGSIPTDRKIYVEGDNYTGGVSIDGSVQNLGTLNGLIGVDGSASTFITGTVTIQNLAGGFTLQGFDITGGVDIHHVAGNIILKDIKAVNSGGNGIEIDNAASAVSLEDISSNGNGGAGAFINNASSGKPYNVTIKNAYFDDNNVGGVGNVYGLQVLTLGKINLENISASRNQGAGIQLDTGFSSLTIKNAVMMSNDANPDDPFLGFGLYAASPIKANISLDMVMVGDSKENTDAIYLGTAGSVTVKNSVSQANVGTGMRVNNLAGTGFVKIYESKFGRNGSTGLDIDTNGTVYLSSIDASHNGANGADITAGNTVTITSQKSLGALGANDFSDNTGVGLSVTGFKTIAVSNIIANDNGGTGVYLSNTNGTSGVTFKKTLPSSQYYTFNNSVNRNGSDGLYIRSKGAVQVEYLVAEDNDLEGVDINNSTATASPGIKVLYTEAHENGHRGLYLISKGSVSLTNTSANLNGDISTTHGLHINTLSGTAGGVTITGTGGYICSFDENTDRGIYMDALGNVSIKNARANANNNSTYIANHIALTNRTVQLVNFEANGTGGGSGLEIYTKGNVTLDTVYTSENDDDGTYISNTYGSGAVSVKKSVFSGNKNGNGLNVYSYKNISLYSVQANENESFGIYLNNCQHMAGFCTGTGSITITSPRNTYNTFNNNGVNGAFMESKGNITLSNIIADENEANGLYVYNDSDSASSGNVTLSSSTNMRNSFKNNKESGLIIASLGHITVSNIDVYGNEPPVFAAYFDNQSAPTPKNVKVKDSTFLRNEGNGLNIASSGSVTLQGIDASDNSIYQGTLNIAGSGVRDVLSSAYEPDTYTFTAASIGDAYAITLNSYFFDAYLELRGPDGALIDFDDNSGGGTNASISGTVPAIGDYTIHVLSADGAGSGAFELSLNGGGASVSGYDGVEINNETGSGSVNILYSSKMGFGLRTSHNTYRGLRIDSTGPVTIDRGYSDSNGSYGFTIDNSADSESPITLKNSTVLNSFFEGFYINSRGNIILNQVESHNNRYENAYIDNSSAVDQASWIKISLSDFSGSIIRDNLGISSTGNITLSNVTSNNSSFNGVVVSNNLLNAVGNVTINGKANTFDNNTESGATINSNGTISLTNIMASNNGNHGVYVRNAYAGVQKNVTVTASGGKILNTLNDNGNYGLYIRSYGVVSVNKVESILNANGTYIDTTNSPSNIKVSVANSVFRESSASGLMIYAYGPITVSNTWVQDNADYGVYVYNNSVADQDVTLKSITVSGSVNHGVYVQSLGFVKLENSTISGNTGMGVYLNNSGGAEGVQVLNTTSANNLQSGMQIYSQGALIMKNINTINNHIDGILFNGFGSGALVTMNNIYSGLNWGSGIYLDNVVDVTISGATASANGTPSINSDGLYINGSGGGNISLSKSTFIGNFGNGVELFSTASLTQTNTLIFGNDIDGSGDPNLYQH